MSSIEFLLIVIDYSIDATSRLQTREGIRLRDAEPANADAHDYCPLRERRSTLPTTSSDYAEPERVSRDRTSRPCAAAILAARNKLYGTSHREFILRHKLFRRRIAH